MPGRVRRIVYGGERCGRSYIVSDTRFPAGDVAPGQPVRVGAVEHGDGPGVQRDGRPVPDGVILRTLPIIAAAR